MTFRDASWSLALCFAFLTGLAGMSRADGPPAPGAVTTPTTTPPRQGVPVDLVLCLDASGSMDGLIDAAKRKLWDVVSLLAQARPNPRLRVALYRYGMSGLDEQRHIERLVPLTDDLDQVYEKLVAVTTDGGDEFVGGVVHRALEDLDWSKDGNALRVLYVAGNESADQDQSHPFRAVCASARQEGVIVNAIYCGEDTPGGDAAAWREVAQQGGGAYVAIDMQGTIQVQAPQDEQLTRLSGELNGTYLPYGRDGARGCENQKAQDSNAAGAESAASRAQAKGSSLYWNGSWDLVDARAAEGFDWAKIAEADLPEALKGKTVAEREAVIAGLAAKRKELQGRIQALGVERQKFVDAALAARAAEAAHRPEGGKAADSIDAGLLHALKEQAKARGFTFE